MVVRGEARPIDIRNPVPRGRYDGLLEMDFSIIEDCKGNSRLVTGWRDRLRARLKARAAASARNRSIVDDYPPAVRIVGFESMETAGKSGMGASQAESSPNKPDASGSTSGLVSARLVPMAPLAQLASLPREAEQDACPKSKIQRAWQCSQVSGIYSRLHSDHGARYAAC
eukprot:jgi/Tetstr1/431336/TSEL_021027.t1